jgi:glycosyltransferase involved in cell wall biosynthesis
MNILLINHYVGSEKMGMEFRPYYFAKQWLADGHKVTVVGATYSHLRKIQPVKAGLENIEGVDYIWLWTNRYVGNGVARLASMFLFVIQLLLFAFRFVWFAKPNVVIASSTYPLDVFPAWIIAKLSRAKLVFEIHDLWPMSPMELGKMSKWHPFIIVMRFGEWFAYKFSDHIISIIPGVYEHLKKDGVPRSRFTAIPNGAIENPKIADELPETLQAQLDKLRAEKKFIIGYAGSIGSANPMHTMFRAMQNLKKEKVALIIVGNGPELKNLKESAKALKDVVFYDKIAKDQVPLFLSKLDAAFIEFADSKLYKYGVGANKIFDYMLAAKPIIQILDTPYDPVKAAECGVTIAPNDYKGVVGHIKRLMSTSPAKLTIMGKNGRVYALEKHNYKYLSKEFLKAVCKQGT